MKPAPFTYHRPASLIAALALLAEHGPDARVLAGGLSLMPLLKSRAIRTGHVIDIAALNGRTTRLTREPLGLRVGARVRQHEVSTTDHPLLAATLAHVGNWQTRRTGTIAGIVAFRNPTSQLAAVCGATNALVTAVSTTDTRVLEASALFQGTQQLRPTELITAVTFPHADETDCAYVQVGRRATDTLIAGVAVRLRRTEGRCVAATVCPVTLGHAGNPVPAAADALVGRRITEADRREAARATAAAIEPRTDLFADAAYRRAAVAALVERALERSGACAR